MNTLSSAKFYSNSWVHSGDNGMGLARICLILLFTILVGSCAGAPAGPPKLLAAVTHHHGFGPQSQSPRTRQANVSNGEGIRIVAWGEEQTNSLRHETYQRLIAAKLRAGGFRVEDNLKAKSRYIARFRYWDSGSRVRTSQGSVTTGSPGQLVDVHGSLIWLPGTMITVPTTKSVTTYVRNLVVEIFDTNDMKVRSSAKHKSPKKIFEGYVVSEGKNPSVHDVIKALIDVMFEKFPAPSGQRRMVSVTFSR